MARPGQVFGETVGCVALAQQAQATEMIAVQRIGFAADGQADAMQRQRMVAAQRRQLRMRQAARAHVILGMHLEEGYRRGIRLQGSEMRGLEGSAGLAWQHGCDSVRDVRRPVTKGWADAGVSASRNIRPGGIDEASISP